MKAKLLLLISAVILLSACSPKVGSEEWCQMMQKKDKGDWTMQEAKDYSKHCLFK